MGRTAPAVLWLALGLTAVVLFLPGLAKIAALNHQRRALAVEVETLRQENEALKLRVWRLQKDPAFIEQRAREQLGLTREGEIVLQVAPEDEAAE